MMITPFVLAVLFMLLVIGLLFPPDLDDED